MMHPVLLLHGALGSKTQLDPLKTALEESGREVYSLNFSGHGGKPFRDPFGIEGFSEDVLHFLKEKGLNATDVFGYSMGGYVALWLAHRYPDSVSKIVALGTKFDWSPEAAEREVKKVNPDKIEEKIPAFARILQSRHAPNDWKELLHKTAQMMTQLGARPLLTTEMLKTIPHQVSILLGDLDDMADLTFSQSVAEALPHGKFSLLEKTPHPLERVDVKLLQKLIYNVLGE
jgi:pimeloyl-ACP methyl ester carboxylesterase